MIEIAVSSLREDQEMAFVYAEAEVQEYWIVQPRQRQVEVFRHPKGGQYLSRQVYETADIVESSALPGVSIVLAELLAEAGA